MVRVGPRAVFHGQDAPALLSGIKLAGLHPLNLTLCGRLIDLRPPLSALVGLQTRHH